MRMRVGIQIAVRNGPRVAQQLWHQITSGCASSCVRSGVSHWCGPSVNVRSVDAPLDGEAAAHSPGEGLCSEERARRALALAEVARQHHAPLLRFLTQRTGSIEDAKEIAQDAYVKVLAVERQGSIASLGSYLWRSALNLMTDRGRRRLVRERFAQAVRAEAEQLAPSAEAVVDARQRLERIEVAVAQLPPRCRDAFVLRVVQGRPFDEVGREMGISGRMAKIYVARALASLHASVEGPEGSGDDL